MMMSLGLSTRASSRANLVLVILARIIHDGQMLWGGRRFGITAPAAAFASVWQALCLVCVGVDRARTEPEANGSSFRR